MIRLLVTLRMEAHITTVNAGSTAAIIQYERVGAHARGSLIIPHSPPPALLPPLYFTLRISLRFEL